MSAHNVRPLPGFCPAMRREPICRRKRERYPRPMFADGEPEQSGRRYTANAEGWFRRPLLRKQHAVLESDAYRADGSGCDSCNLSDFFDCLFCAPRQLIIPKRSH